MKVMIQAPWESKPHGPYEADWCPTPHAWVRIGETFGEVPKKWCTILKDTKFPEGFPVSWRGTVILHAWYSEDMDPDVYSWPRAPWESAPEGAKQWIVTEDAACNWSWDGGYAVGDQFCGAEIVHVEERE